MKEHDDLETPVCALCGERIGTMNDAVLILRGQFFQNRQEGYPMFLLDPDTKYVNVELPDALGPGQHQQALVIDHNEPFPIVPAHLDCLREQVSTVDEDDEEDDDLDADMHSAMDRDFDPMWDDNDMLGRRRVR